MKDLDMPTTFCQQRHITAFFYAAFTIPMAVQLLSLGQEAVHPTELKTTMNKESLFTFDDFPLLARICVKTFHFTSIIDIVAKHFFSLPIVLI